MRAGIPLVVLFSVLVGCQTTVPGVKSTVKISDTVTLTGKVLDAAGNPRPKADVALKQAGNPLGIITSGNTSGPIVVQSDGTFNYKLRGGITANAQGTPYLLTLESSGSAGEWISQEFYVTKTTQEVPQLKFWDDLTATIATDTGDLTVKWTPPAGAKFQEGWLIISQDFQDIWTVKLGNLAQPQTYNLPASVLDDLHVCNVKVKLHGSPTSYDTANHNFTTGTVGGTKILAIASATGEDGLTYPALIDGVKGKIDFRPEPSPGPSLKPGATLSNNSAVILDLGASKAVSKLAFYNSGTDKASFTVTISDAPDGKGGKTYGGGASSTLLDLGSAKGRYIRVAGDRSLLEGMSEIRAIAP